MEAGDRSARAASPRSARRAIFLGRHLAGIVGRGRAPHRWSAKRLGGCFFTGRGVKDGDRSGRSWDTENRSKEESP